MGYWIVNQLHLHTNAELKEGCSIIFEHLKHLNELLPKFSFKFCSFISLRQNSHFSLIKFSFSKYNVFFSSKDLYSYTELEKIPTIIRIIPKSERCKFSNKYILNHIKTTTKPMYSVILTQLKNLTIY